MYITKVVLKNIRCFDEFTLEFDRKKRSCLLVGDNGEGKSTLLRSIAMGLCDESSAAALFRELQGRFIRRRSTKGESYIEIHLRDIVGRRYVVRTEFHRFEKRRALGLERLKQKLSVCEKSGEPEEIGQADFPWERVFVAAYGAGARTLGAGAVDSYLPVDAVYSLFRYDEPLQNPELALRRMKDEARKRGKRSGLRGFLELLRGVLNLGKGDKVYLTRHGIEVLGPWGRSELETLGDGYKSTITWVLDLIGRRLLYGRTLNPRLMTGIVLIDEVEQHLHPKWQLSVMELLRASFPKIQFIATTHSPLVVSGCRDCKIRKVTSEHDEPDNAYGWRAEDVYRDILDLERLRPLEVQMYIERYRSLDLRSLTAKLSDKERKEMRRLKQELGKTIHGSDPTLLSLELRNIKAYLKTGKGKP